MGTIRSLMRRREELSEPDPERADRDVENRSNNPNVGRVRSLHAAVLEPRSAIEAARTARAPLKALEHDLPRRVHPRAVHRHSPARRLLRSPRPDRTPTRPTPLVVLRRRRCRPRLGRPNPRVRIGRVSVEGYGGLGFGEVQGVSGKIVVVVAGGGGGEREPRRGNRDRFEAV